MRSIIPLTVVYVILLNLRLASAHGTLVDPVSRNSLWRIDNSAPVNYNDIELFCGGIGVSSVAALFATDKDLNTNAFVLTHSLCACASI